VFVYHIYIFYAFYRVCFPEFLIPRIVKMGNRSSVGFQDEMHVVIVGGGYTGSYLAVNLLKDKLCKVTLIDPKDAMIHHIGALRTVVDESRF